MTCKLPAWLAFARKKLQTSYGSILPPTAACLAMLAVGLALMARRFRRLPAWVAGRRSLGLALSTALVQSYRRLRLPATRLVGLRSLWRTITATMETAVGTSLARTISRKVLELQMVTRAVALPQSSASSAIKPLGNSSDVAIVQSLATSTTSVATRGARRLHLELVDQMQQDRCDQDAGVKPLAVHIEMTRCPEHTLRAEALAHAWHGAQA